LAVFSFYGQWVSNMVRNKVVITNNKELYNKLNMLLYSTDVVIKGVDERYLTRILKNINKHNNVLDIEKIGDYFLLKKNGPCNFSVYFREK
jgi:hypothetical protein